MTEKEYYQNLGKTISNLRGSRNVNQETLASFLNISRPSIGNIEKGRQKPSVYLIQKIADYFGVNVDNLLPEIPKQVERMRIIGDLTHSKSINELFDLIISKQ